MDMIEKINTIKSNFEFARKEEIIDLISENLYLTVSELRIVFEIIEEINFGTEIDVYEKIYNFIEKEEINIKERSKKFIKKLKEFRYPKICKSKAVIDSYLKELKISDVNFIVPENLEGGSLVIEINAINKKKTTQIIEKLYKDKEKISELSEFIKRGD